MDADGIRKPRQTAGPNSHRLRLPASVPIALSLGLLLAGSLSFAGSLEDLYIGGFVSQGYIDTSENNYLVPKAREGSGEFNEVGVALSITPADRTRIGIQFLARDLGEEGNNQVMIDWAFGDYHWRDDLGFRAGKLKLPYGFYNVVRDVDVARPFVLLPQGVYDERIRDFFTAYEGASLYGNLHHEPVGDLDYEFYVGTLNVPSPESGFWGDIFQRTGESAAADSSFRADVGDLYGVDVEYISSGGFIDPHVALPWLVGGALTWTPPVEGLRFGGSWLRSRYEASARLLFNVQARDRETGRPEYFGFDIPDPRIQDDVEYIMSLSAEFARDSYSAALEYTLQNTGGTDHVGDTPVTEGYYLSGSYRLLRDITVGAYYSRYWNDRNDRDGEEALRNGYPEFSAWQHDLCISARFDVSPNWLLKLEEHWVDGVGQLSPSENQDANGQTDANRYWSYFAAKATFHF
ncbi:MAG: hypothetical protein KDA27_19415 [Candidatus Eisenbacteria bacterium]|uniref:Porin n=1 Tax=Eiseniibacteriota bacterium TaxID=2212470 RepID=A0A956SEV9_UNCEI|nr:hypothetical protein [Candidatus Eisenbacteria bacterium]MCB9463314.1 hypothetical protein [Candidatus Eisenbacteria bacterium]